MKKYVCGLMFSSNKESVALIVKNKPDWQKGLLNGIGGKIEEFDSINAKNLKERSLNAMCREFKEETGVETFPQNWNLFLTMGSDIGKANDENIQQYNESWQVDFYRCFDDKVYNVQTQEEENVVVRNICDLLSLNTIDYL